MQPEFINSKLGGQLLVIENHIFRKFRTFKSTTNWRCNDNEDCRARVTLWRETLAIKSVCNEHNDHPTSEKKICRRQIFSKCRDAIMKNPRINLHKVYKKLVKSHKGAEGIPAWDSIKSSMHRFRIKAHESMEDDLEKQTSGSDDDSNSKPTKEAEDDAASPSSDGSTIAECHSYSTSDSPSSDTRTNSPIAECLTNAASSDIHSAIAKCLTNAASSDIHSPIAECLTNAASSGIHSPTAKCQYNLTASSGTDSPIAECQNNYTAPSPSSDINSPMIECETILKVENDDESILPQSDNMDFTDSNSSSKTPEDENFSCLKSPDITVIKQEPSEDTVSTAACHMEGPTPKVARIEDAQHFSHQTSGQRPTPITNSSTPSFVPTTSPFQIRQNLPTNNMPIHSKNVTTPMNSSSNGMPNMRMPMNSNNTSTPVNSNNVMFRNTDLPLNSIRPMNSSNTDMPSHTNSMRMPMNSNNVDVRVNSNNMRMPMNNVSNSNNVHVNSNDMRMPMNPNDMRMPMNPNDMRMPMNPNDMRMAMNPNDMRMPMNPNDMRMPMNPNYMRMPMNSNNPNIPMYSNNMRMPMNNLPMSSVGPIMMNPMIRTDSRCRVVPPVRDHFDAYGEYLASKLRQLDSRSVAYVQKTIGDIIFDAELKTFK